MKVWNFRGQQNSISEALQLTLPDHAVISMVGAGGKTSLITSWARELASEGKKVVITTTTHMMHPEFADPAYPGRAIIYYPNYRTNEVDMAEDSRQIDDLLETDRILMLASVDPDNNKKVTAPPASLLKYAYQSADVVLIEADGSRRMPLKWPAEHEPVVPENTFVSICVAGLSSLGRSADEVMYNADALPELLRNEAVDEAMITFIVSSPDAGLKGTYGDYRVYLNQADNEELQKKAADIQRLLAVRGIQCAWGTLI